MKKVVLGFFTAAFVVVAVLSSTPSYAAPGVQPWNTNCNRFYNQRKKKPKHKAFVVAASDYQQSCGAAWGYATVEAAKKEAVKWCKKQPSAGANCVITKAE